MRRLPYLLLFTVLDAAAVPTTVVHQGQLLDAAGQPTNGPAELDFALYPSEAEAVPALWQESHSVVLQNGYYAVVLGNNTPLDSAILASDLQLWLGIGLAGNTSRREPLHSVPFAVTADNSRTLSRSDCAVGQVLAFDGVSWACTTVGGALGDVKWSMLEEEAFAEENGPGWLRWTGQSLEGTDLAELTGLAELPDPSGYFLKAIGSDSRSPASVESFATAAQGLSVTIESAGNHGHSASTSSAGAHSHTLGVNGTDTFSMAPGGATQRLAHFRSDGFGGGGAKTTNSAGGHGHSVSVGAAGAHSHPGRVTSSAAETRPRNIALHLYVKVNR